MSLSLPDVRQVLHLLGALLLVALVVPFVIYAVPGVVGAEGGYVVLSGSMEPEISTGDVVIVGETDPATIQEGDVITYVRSGDEIPTTHRVVDVVESDGELAFRTQGDANDNPDASPVPASQVNGIVILTIPYIGYVVEFVNTPYGFVALVVVPLVILVLSELHSIFVGTDETAAEELSEPSATAAPSTAAAEDLDSFDDGGTGMGPSERPPLAGNGDAQLTGNDESTASNGTTVEDDATIAITRTDMRLTLGLLVGATVYAVWVVTRIREPWSFSVAFASGIGLVLVGGMYYLAGSEPPSDQTAEPDVTDSASPVLNAATNGSRAALSRRIISGSLSIRDRESVEVTVESIERLARMAVDADEWIIDDVDTDGYVLLQDGVVYSWYPGTPVDEDRVTDPVDTGGDPREEDANGHADSGAPDGSRDPSETRE